MDEAVSSAEDLRWGPSRRLEFIDFRLMWEGRINRSDIRDRFGISAPQASADLAAYERLAPENMRYDRAQRTFVRADGFRPLLVAGLSDRFLMQLQAVRLDLLPVQDTWFSTLPPLDVAAVRRPQISDDVLRSVLDAIRNGAAIRVEYRTMSGKPASERLLAPHALGQGTGRWHARCWDAAERTFRDFNLNRMIRVLGSERTDADSRLDLEWHTRVDLRLCPNPAFAKAKQEAIRTEYAFEGAEHVVSSRIALIFYLYHELNLGRAGGQLAPEQRPLVLANLEEVERARAAAADMMARAVKAAVGSTAP